MLQARPNRLARRNIGDGDEMVMAMVIRKTSCLRVSVHRRQLSNIPFSVKWQAAEPPHARVPRVSAPEEKTCRRGAVDFRGHPQRAGVRHRIPMATCIDLGNVSSQRPQ